MSTTNNYYPIPVRADYVLECGHYPTSTDGIGTGYVVCPDHRRICYDCANAKQHARTLDPNTTAAGGYVDDEWKYVTTWSGGKLLRITAHSARRVFNSTSYNIWAIGDDGRRWYGVGNGRGMSVNLRRIK